MRTRRSQPGFTLMEVVVALTIAGMLALMAHRLMVAATDGSHALVTLRREADREANGRRWLAAAFLSLEAGSGLGGFDGRSNRLAFSTWLQEPGGWFRATRVVVEQEGQRLVARSDSAPMLVLRNGVQQVEFDYLLEPGESSRWVREWISPLSAPLAVRLRLYRSGQQRGLADTLLLLIKERG